MKEEYHKSKKDIMNNRKETPLSEVWLLTSSPEGITIRPRVFAVMGNKEVAEIAEQIASLYENGPLSDKNRVSNLIQSELENGETEIHISDKSGDLTEFVIALTDIDTGTDWCGNEYVIDYEVEKREVFKGGTIHASTGWHSDVELLFSTPNKDTSLELKVE